MIYLLRLLDDLAHALHVDKAGPGRWICDAFDRRLLKG